MKVALITVPFDSGHLHERMGAGPQRLIEGGLRKRFSAAGAETSLTPVLPESGFPTEIETAFELHRLTGGAVRAALEAGAFPLVLAGNCNISAMGGLTGIGAAHPSLVWFDGHADFTTPETAETGFLDGMGLAMATGRCWRPMTRALEGFRPVADRNTVLAGAHDIEMEEGKELRRSGIAHFPPEALRRKNDAFRAHLEEIAGHTDATYLHIDLDVCEPSIARANHLAPPGGITPGELKEAARTVIETLPVAAMGFSAYDPSCDPEGVMLAAAINLAAALVAAMPDRTR